MLYCKIINVAGSFNAISQPKRTEIESELQRNQEVLNNITTGREYAGWAVAIHNFLNWNKR